MDIDLQNIGFIVLAAGLGKRMKSDIAKVLHNVHGKPIIHYVLDVIVKLAGSNVYVVVGYQSEKVRSSIEKSFAVQYVEQKKQLGTGHAVACAIPFLNSQIKHVIVLCGDTPLISQNTIQLLLDIHLVLSNQLTVLAVEMENPTGYGRIIFSEDHHIEAIIEEADATDSQRNINIVNAGIYCIETSFLEEAVGLLTNNNAQKEMYLTDIVEIGFRRNKAISAVICDDPIEMLGVNTQADLRNVERQMQLKLSKNLDFHISP